MHQKMVDETNFVRLLEKKDERALDYVIDTYGGLIKAVVHKHLYNFPDKCDECINDILLAVWTEIKHYNSEKCSFSGWLAAVSKYKAIDYKRRYCKQLAESPLPEEETDIKSNPEESVLEQEISEEMQNLLQHLSEEDRKLFWDCYVKEEPVQSLAKKRNMNVAALYNRLSRGKKKLRQCREGISK